MRHQFLAARSAFSEVMSHFLRKFNLMIQKLAGLLHGLLLNQIKLCVVEFNLRDISIQSPTYCCSFGSL